MKKLSKIRSVKRYIFLGGHETPYLIYYKEGYLTCLNLITRDESYFTKQYSCRHALLDDIKDGYPVIYKDRDIDKYLMGMELSR